MGPALGISEKPLLRREVLMVPRRDIRAGATRGASGFLGLGVKMRVGSSIPSAVTMFGGRGLDRHDMQVGMTHAPLRGEGIGKAPHLTERSPQNGHLQAGLVVEMDMHPGNAEVVMIVKGAGQPLRQSTGFMVVDIAEYGDTRHPVGQGDLASGCLSHHIAHGL